MFLIAYYLKNKKPKTDGVETKTTQKHRKKVTLCPLS